MVTDRSNRQKHDGEMFNKMWLTQFKNCHQLEMVLLMVPCTCVAVQLRRRHGWSFK